MYMGCKLMRGLPTGLFRKRVWGGWGQKDGRLEISFSHLGAVLLVHSGSIWYVLFSWEDRGGKKQQPSKERS